MYLLTMYRALFALSYYGMMRVGEVTLSDHVVKAKDIHSATNKDKIMLKLYTSTTHSRGMKPQSIKITSNLSERSGYYAKRNFCPFKLINDYMNIRGGYNGPPD